MQRDFLFFSKADRLALLLLAAVAIILLTLLVGRSWGRRLSEAPHTADTTSTATPAIARATTGDTLRRVKHSATLQLQTFDPNTVSFDQLAHMGFSNYMAVNLIKWRESGKVFRIPQEILLTHGWEDLDWQQLEPYVVIAPQFRPRPTTSRSPYSPQQRQERHYEQDQNYDSIVAANPYLYTKFTEHTVIDLNTTDSLELLRVPGIGPFYAGWIISRRTRLGGFYAVEQLLDRPNFPENTLDWFAVSTPVLRKINLSTASHQTLSSHPYIGSRKARAIAQWTRLYGPITSLPQLRNTGIFTQEELERLLPYLSIEDKQTGETDASPQSH